MNDAVPLINLIDERLASGNVELPVLDETAATIHKKVSENSIDAEGIVSLLEQDPILVSEILRMANSSFFAGLSEARNLKEATVRLGNKQIASIVMSISQKRMYSASAGLFQTRLRQLWMHTSVVSLGARWLANSLGYRTLADEAFVAGLLHDVGKLSLLRIIEDLAQTESTNLSDEVVGATLLQLNTSHGAKLLKMWNLPDAFVSVVDQLDAKQFDEHNLTLVIVRLVDKASAVEGFSDFPDPTLALESLPETEILNLSDVDIAELRIVIEDAGSGTKQAA